MTATVLEGVVALASVLLGFGVAAGLLAFLGAVGRASNRWDQWRDAARYYEG